MGIVRSWPTIAVILTGCYVTASFPCFAKHQSIRDRILDFKDMHFLSVSPDDVAKASHPIFQYLYSAPLVSVTPNKDPVILSLQAYKERLRDMVSYEFSPDFQVGLNSFKAGPLEQTVLDVLPLQPALQPRTPDVVKSRGYGVCFTVKLN